MGISRLVDLLDDKRDVIRNGIYIYIYILKKRKGYLYIYKRGIAIIDRLDSQ